MAAPPEPQPVTLDSAREQFYLAQRATERFAAQLGVFVASLQQQKDDDSWLEQVKEEATKTVQFHEEQFKQWSAMSNNIDAYVSSVKALAELMAVNELKGEDTEEAELPENKAKTVHPELVKFQLEKKAKILGKIGGIPALGPGMAVLPVLPKGQILKATASPAAREIYYSKVEHKDAAQLAGVFQFRKAAASDATPVAWQEEETSKNVRRASEAMAAELRRQEEQEQQLAAGGAVGAELAGALRMRQQALRSSEDEEASASASSYRRSSASTSGAAQAPAPERELQAATSELAQKLKQRQEAAEIARRHSESGAQQHEQAAGARAGSSSADGANAPGWSNSSAPFGGELASVLQKMRQNKEAAQAARPVRSSTDATPSISTTASSELEQRLRQRQSRLESLEES